MQRSSIYLLLISVLALVNLGVVMLFSTSAFAQESHGNIYFFIKKDAFWLIIGLAGSILGAMIDYSFWRSIWKVCFITALFLLVLCFVPSIGMKINGSHRWINLHLFVFQPSELGKIASVFFLAWWFSRDTVDATKITDGFLIPIGIVSILIVLIVNEVDLGTSALIGVTTLGICLVAGASWMIIVGVFACGVSGFLAIVMMIPERAARIMTFLHPESEKLGKGLQQWQALIAFGSGGFEGIGLGEGRQKMLYLPYAHTDFIFPMIGEELGLRATFLVIIGYILIIYSGGCIACNARDKFGKFLAMGIILLISIQAAINIGVTTSLFPNKGMPLPFISYGGSNLTVCLFMIGILVNIYRTGIPIIPTEGKKHLLLRSRPLPKI